MRAIRRAVQLIALAAFIATMFTAVGPQPRPHGEPFLRLDPLAALTAALSPAHTALAVLLPAAALLLFTGLFGRFFCGWLCPLGTSIDLTDHLLLRRVRKRDHLNRPSLKYYILAATLVATALGARMVWLADPIPLLSRAWATCIAPALLRAVPALPASLGREGIGIGVTPPIAGEGVAATVVLVGVLALGLVSRRYWCRTLCPLGALLGLVGRLGLIRRHMTGGCSQCGVCGSRCKMGAIDQADCTITRTPECILCWDCVACKGVCPGRIGLTTKMAPDDPRVRLSRRKTLAALVAGAAYGGLAHLLPRRDRAPDTAIRPPGAIMRLPGGAIRPLTEAELRDRCVRCGMCMTACPTAAIQPAGFDAGVGGVLLPTMVPVVGACLPACNACGQVCPTGALAQFSIEEKSRIRIGLARVHQDRCLSWRRGDDYTHCLTCASVCPYGAVERLSDGGQERPRVNSAVCVGCGTCEHNCPARPLRAITVSRRPSA
ncbi:MAG TPA: 4Fe-4S binding protein [Armatimonadota bacterium]|nr:4Fe-4S binding protein [Armatimonadota bacterium]